VTIYIIESSAPLPPTHDDGDHALDLREGDAVILSQGASIEAHGFRASGIWGTTNTTLQIDGRVFSRLERAITTHGAINVGATGEVSGFDAGIWFMQDYRDGSANTLNNAGCIYGYLSGITLFGTNNFINNSGQIVGAIGIYATSSDALDEKLVINNTGLIKSSEEDYAIIGVLHGPNIITNRGHVEGEYRWVISTTFTMAEVELLTVTRT
jgi:hypothetical protein